jgi:hypothetical protein
MMNWGAKLSSGVALVGADGQPLVQVSTVPGKVLSVFGAVIPNGIEPDAILQVYDTLTLPVSGSAWPTPPVLQFIALDVVDTLGPGQPIVFKFPLLITTGCILTLSTSYQKYVAVGGSNGTPAYLGCQFVPDLNAVPPGVQN